MTNLDQRIGIFIGKYIALSILRDITIAVQIVHLQVIKDDLYTIECVFDTHAHCFALAQVKVSGIPNHEQIDVQAVYLDSSFMLGYMQSQFKPTIDGLLLEPIVRKEIKLMVKRILHL